jgi:hypothetical protein
VVLVDVAVAGIRVGVGGWVGWATTAGAVVGGTGVALGIGVFDGKTMSGNVAVGAGVFDGKTMSGNVAVGIGVFEGKMIRGKVEVGTGVFEGARVEVG